MRIYFITLVFIIGLSSLLLGQTKVKEIDLIGVWQLENIKTSSGIISNSKSNQLLVFRNDLSITSNVLNIDGKFDIRNDRLIVYSSIHNKKLNFHLLNIDHNTVVIWPVPKPNTRVSLKQYFFKRKL